MADVDIRRYSLAELRAMRERGESRISADAPAFPVDEGFWREARVAPPPRKVHTGLRIDADVLEWFRSRGKGFQSHMNTVLRAYVEAQKSVGTDR
jgi:uncharacterized protein (DUF4415 family)